jgi:hypothetical protein
LDNPSSGLNRPLRLTPPPLELMEGKNVKVHPSLAPKEKKIEG